MLSNSDRLKVAVYEYVEVRLREGTSMVEIEKSIAALAELATSDAFYDFALER